MRPRRGRWRGLFRGLSGAPREGLSEGASNSLAPALDIAKFMWGDIGTSPHNFLAVGAIAAVESAPMPTLISHRIWL